MILSQFFMVDFNEFSLHLKVVIVNNIS